MEARVKEITESGKFDEAIDLLTKEIDNNPQHDGLLFLRGKIYWKKGDKKSAMNDYASAAKLNPDSPAAVALEQAHEVASFFNPDLLNP